MLEVQYFIKRKEWVERDLFWSHWKSEMHRQALNRFADIYGLESYADTMALNLEHFSFGKLQKKYQTQMYDAVVDVRFKTGSPTNLSVKNKDEYLSVLDQKLLSWIDHDRSSIAIIPSSVSERSPMRFKSSSSDEYPGNELRLLLCTKRAKNMSPATFSQFWQSDEHRDLLTAAAESTGAESYSYTLAAPGTSNTNHINLLGFRQPYDGIIDFRWKDMEALSGKLESHHVKHFMKLLFSKREDWVDLQGSAFILTERPSRHGGTVTIRNSDKIITDGSNIKYPFSNNNAAG